MITNIYLINLKNIFYLKDLEVDVVEVPFLFDGSKEGLTDQYGNIYSPHNLYCNILLEQVKEGWIVFLDDDDCLIHDKVVEEIVETIKQVDEDTLIIWQMRYPNGKLVPSNQAILKNEIQINNIGSPCFAFHYKYKSLAQWDEFKRSDFRFVKQLSQIIPKKLFLNQVYIQINNFGDFGRRNDLDLKSKLPFTFYKNWFWYLIPKYHYTILGIKLFHRWTYRNFVKKMIAKISRIFKY